MSQSASILKRSNIDGTLFDVRRKQSKKTEPLPGSVTSQRSTKNEYNRTPPDDVTSTSPDDVTYYADITPVTPVSPGQQQSVDEATSRVPDAPVVYDELQSTDVTDKHHLYANVSQQ